MRLSDEELAEIRRWADMFGAEGYTHPVDISKHRRKLLDELDAVKAERDEALEQNEANVKCREASDRANLGLLDQLADAERRGWEAARRAALARCGPRNTVAECIGAIAAMQPPQPANEPTPANRTCASCDGAGAKACASGVLYCSLCGGSGKEPTTSEAAAPPAGPVPARGQVGERIEASEAAFGVAVASGAADEPTSLQRATAAVLDEAGMTLADEPKASICGAPTTYIPGEWCELPEGHDGAHGRGSRVPAADEPKGERPVEREIAAAYAQDRSEQYTDKSSAKVALEDLANALRRGVHVEAYEHGELDDLLEWFRNGASERMDKLPQKRWT